MRELQLAKLTDRPPEGEAWVHEQKFDGYRILAEKRASSIKLWSRNGKDWTSRFASIAAALGELPARTFAIDGEVGALLPDGRTSFQALQASRASAPLAYFVFDLLALDDRELAAQPLLARKAELAKLVAAAPTTVRYSDHIAGSGHAFFQLACQQGLEGIISKRADRGYSPGAPARGRGTWQRRRYFSSSLNSPPSRTSRNGLLASFGSMLVRQVSNHDSYSAWVAKLVEIR